MTAAIPTLLVVDDEPDIRLLVRTLLAEEYDFVEAGGGAEALAILESTPKIDVVLLDIRMPDVDGLAVMERMSAIDALANVPVVAFSAHAEPRMADDVLRHGARALVRKPFDRDDLTRALRAAAAA